MSALLYCPRPILVSPLTPRTVHTNKMAQSMDWVPFDNTVGQLLSHSQSDALTTTPSASCLVQQHALQVPGPLECEREGVHARPSLSLVIVRKRGGRTVAEDLKELEGEVGMRGRTGDERGGVGVLGSSSAVENRGM